MANERLRNSISAALMTVEEVAARVQVDPKTVERWIRTDRVPHPRHRRATAAPPRTTEGFLWPELLGEQRRAPPGAPFIGLSPHRAGLAPRTSARPMRPAPDYS